MSAAIVGEGAAVQGLAVALDGFGVGVVRYPMGEPREVLRWVMELTADRVGICVFVDSDGRMTASLTTALDPAIPALAWAAGVDDAARLLSLLSETPAVVTTSADVGRVARIIVGLMGGAAGASVGVAAWPGSGGDVLTGNEGPEMVMDSDDEDGDMAEAGAAGAKVPAETAGADEDYAVYHQLEALMAQSVKDMPKREPVPVQQAGLDFSIPLRKLMSAGREMAQEGGHGEVAGVHYLASLDDPFAVEFAGIGLDGEALRKYIGEHVLPLSVASGAVVSDGVFDAVEMAKGLARADDRNCVQVADFLLGLVRSGEGTIAELGQAAGVSAEEMEAAVAKVGPAREACEGSFFAPSSLDQDSFYRFDSAQVKDVEKRLLALPGFHKAAKRIPAGRKRAGSDQSVGAAKPQIVGPIERVLSPVPDVPVVERVNSDFPDVETIEYAADCLLEGQVIGFPADIMFALAADGSNPAAIERLREAAGLLPEKPLSILIHSKSQLKHLVKADLDRLEGFLDTLWPGPLTLIFDAAPGVGHPIAPARKIAVRQPGDNLSLAVLSMLGRPLAVTSWDEVAPAGVSVVKLAEEKLAGQVALLVDAGVEAAAPSGRTTVVDLTTSPWTVVRAGDVDAERVLEFDPAGS